MKNRDSKNGSVFLVGAGPGDPGLITVRGLELLQEADAVVYDSLIHSALLDQVSPSAEKHYAGKRISPSPKKSSHPDYVDQDSTNRLLVKLARQGKKVVRLKGGDPFVFGRGGEEASYLKKAGISFEVVPGVTAGTAAPAFAGIPVTDRRLASQVTFVTAHENPDKQTQSVDWEKLGAMPGTLVIFMGLKNLPGITARLMDGGKSPAAAACVIQSAAMPAQKMVSGTLGNIAALAARAEIRPPAVTVIGDVCRLRTQLDWCKRPLAGKTVLVTRASRQAGTLKALLERQGARVLELPVIEIRGPKSWREIDQTLAEWDGYDWIVFTSTNGVDAFFGRLQALGKDSRIFWGKKIAVIGEATAQALEKRGLVPDLLPAAYTSEALAAKLKTLPLRGKSFLLARTNIAPPYLRLELQRMGAKVKDLAVYRTEPGLKAGQKKELEKQVRARKIDFVTFTSSSTVTQFFSALPQPLRKNIGAKCISIGPATSRTLKEHGYQPFREAGQHTIPGLVKAIIQASLKKAARSK